MSSFVVTVYDRPKDEPNKRVMREFEVMGNYGCALRAAWEAYHVTPEAGGFEIERV